jgi:hypothetical protein
VIGVELLALAMVAAAVVTIFEIADGRLDVGI